MRRATIGAMLCVLVAMGCSARSEVTPPAAGPHLEAKPDEVRAAKRRVRDALKLGRVDELRVRGEEALAAGADDAWIHAAMAVGTYYETVSHFSPQLVAVLDQLKERNVDHVRGRRAFTELEAGLARTDAHLAKAATDPDFALELCPACWLVDWNGLQGLEDDVGRFEIDYDHRGRSIPKDDPRRTPTIRFDHGDVLFLRAYLSMQRGLLDIFLAYDWHELDAAYADGAAPRFTLRVESAPRLEQARARLLDALEHADAARRAYLAETDDEQEWMPSPTQESRTMSWQIDASYYASWEALVPELAALIEGEEGLSIEEFAQIGDHKWDHPPQGFINVGRLLTDAVPITIPLKEMYGIDFSQRVPVERVLRDLFGDAYEGSMKSSPLVARIDQFERKNASGVFAYLFILGYMTWVP